jgi:hypothetical protein
LQDLFDGVRGNFAVELDDKFPQFAYWLIGQRMTFEPDVGYDHRGGFYLFFQMDFIEETSLLT